MTKYPDYFRTPGIYCIVNKINGNRYVGSTNNLLLRFHNHRSELRRGVHQNSHLQRAFNKYGEENFNFIVMCDCEVDDLLIYEQVLIDKLKPEYNLSKIAGEVTFTPEEIQRRREAKLNKPIAGGEKYLGIELRSTDGHIIKIENCVSTFCRKYNLDPSHISKLLRGLRSEHKGWTICHS